MPNDLRVDVRRVLVVFVRGVRVLGMDGRRGAIIVVVCDVLEAKVLRTIIPSHIGVTCCSVVVPVTRDGGRNVRRGDRSMSGQMKKKKKKASWLELYRGG